MNNEEKAKLKQKAARAEKENNDFLKNLRKKKNLKLDRVLYELHEEAFDLFDCLECANCCRSISPIVYERDIDRISRYLKMKPSKVTEQYFEKDDEGDFVFRDTPCPLLMENNYCSVYEVRPKSCRNYPHTSKREFIRNYKVTIKNTYICPIAFYVLEKLKERLGPFL